MAQPSSRPPLIGSRASAFGGEPHNNPCTTLTSRTDALQPVGRRQPRRVLSPPRARNRPGPPPLPPPPRRPQGTGELEPYGTRDFRTVAIVWPVSAPDPARACRLPVRVGHVNQGHRNICSYTCYDTSMGTDAKCPVCTEPFTDADPAVLVPFTEWRRSRKHAWHSGGALRMCHRCASSRRLDTEDKFPNALVRASNPVFVTGMDRGRCEVCNVPMRYEPDSRRKHLYCSTACRMTLYRSVREAVTYECAVCGVEYTPSRSDSRYCSNACRQKSARQRAAAR